MVEFLQGFPDSTVGRLNRRNYFLGYLIVTMALMSYAYISRGTDVYSNSMPIIVENFFDKIIMFFLGAIPLTLLNAGRMNDIGVNGWWSILYTALSMISPYVPLLPLLILIPGIALIFWPGKKTEAISHRYSSPTTTNYTDEREMPHTYYSIDGDKVTFKIGQGLNVDENGRWKFIGAIPQTVTLPPDGTRRKFMIRSLSNMYVVTLRLTVPKDNSILQAPDENINIRAIEGIERLNKLKESSAITPDEYETLKQKVISSTS